MSKVLLAVLVNLALTAAWAQPSQGQGCPAASQTGCHVSIAPDKSHLLIRSAPRAKVRWKLSKGDGTDISEFGDPTVSTSYDVCIYDGSSALIFSASAPAGQSCRSKACWKSVTRGFAYDDPEFTPDGLRRIGLKAGPSGYSSVLVFGIGTLLDDFSASLPIANLPLTVQLKNSTNGSCWESQFTTPIVNDERTFKAEGDPLP